jgi:hypothetical protein
MFIPGGAFSEIASLSGSFGLPEMAMLAASGPIVMTISF